MTLLPQEHGAYGQIAFPLVTALVGAGAPAAGLLIASAVVAGFLAHEPAAVLIGLRGARAKRELQPAATRMLAVCLAVAGVTGVSAAFVMAPAVRWSLAVPAIPALVLLVAMVRGQEKSWFGETSAALAFATVPVPIVMAAGLSPAVAWAASIPFALLFTVTTLAVRVVILRVRGGGDPRAASATRLGTLSACAASAVLLGAAAAFGWLRLSVIVASAPGLITAAIVTMRPPSPAHLRRLGWTLVAVSLLTAVIVVMTV